MIFQCIKIHQVPWASASVFNTSHGIWQLLMHEKNMFDPYIQGISNG